MTRRANEAGDLLQRCRVSRARTERWLALAEKALGGSHLRGSAGVALRTTASASSRSTRAAPQMPATRGANPPSPWIVMQRIDDPDPDRANRQALDDIDAGRDRPRAGLRGRAECVRLRAAQPRRKRWRSRCTTCRSTASISASTCIRRAAPCADWLVALLGKRRVDPAKLSVSFGIDPAAIFAGTGRLRMSIEALQGLDAAIAGAFLRARPAGRPARRRRPRLPQCRRDRGAGTRHRARVRRLASAHVRGGAPGAGLCRAAYRLCAQRRSGPVRVDGQAQGAALAVGAGAGGLLDPAGARRRSMPRHPTA